MLMLAGQARHKFAIHSVYAVKYLVSKEVELERSAM